MGGSSRRVRVGRASQKPPGNTPARACYRHSQTALVVSTGRSLAVLVLVVVAASSVVVAPMVVVPVGVRAPAIVIPAVFIPPTGVVAASVVIGVGNRVRYTPTCGNRTSKGLPGKTHDVRASAATQGTTRRVLESFIVVMVEGFDSHGS